jgi:hypothetical protein
VELDMFQSPRESVPANPNHGVQQVIVIKIGERVRMDKQHQDDEGIAK